MMRNTEFETELAKRLEKHYGADYEIQIMDVIKLSQEPLRGLTVKRKEENIAPTIYLDYLAGMNMDESLKTIYDIVKSSGKSKVHFNVESFTDWETARQRIHARLVSADDGLLRELPHRNYLDLAIVYYYVVDMNEDFGRGTITLQLEHLSLWGVSESELYEAAKANAKSEGYTAISMLDILQELCGVNSDSCFCNDLSMPDNQMYVITNHSKFYGATALIFAKECFKALAEKMNSNLYILPSSQHELIAVSDEIAEPQVLKEMVCEVNDSQVDEKERLSYCVYKYNRQADTIDVAA